MTMPMTDGDRFTPEYQFALVACYLGEAFAYLAEGNVEDFFQLGRVAGNSCAFATRLLADKVRIDELVRRLPEVTVTLHDRESGLGIRPSWRPPGKGRPRSKG